MRCIVIVAFVSLLGTGCIQQSGENDKSAIASPNGNSSVANETQEPQDLVVPPINPESALGYHATYKVFGQFVDDRFYGYHAGEDVEVLPEFEGKHIQVRAAADGYIAYKDWVEGYGGVVIIEHEIAGELYRSLYGHIDLASVTQNVGDVLQRGQEFALLGDPYSSETDGERQHLHFSVWKGDSVQLSGYVEEESELAKWLNPQDFYKL